MTYLVYLITRDDGMRYVGTSNDRQLKNRMKQHSKHERFLGHDFTHEILFVTDDYNECLCAETVYVSCLGTYEIGLNKTLDGKGNHLSLNFTTKNYVFSAESREKMSRSWHRRDPKTKKRFCAGQTTVHTEESKRKIAESSVRQVKIFDVDRLIEEFNSGLHQELSGTIMRNGRQMSREQAYAKAVHRSYDLSVTQVRNIVSGKLPKWLERSRKTIATKS